MTKVRERPAGYSDDPTKLGAQIEMGVGENSKTHDYDDFDGTEFYVGEAKLIARVLGCHAELLSALVGMVRCFDPAALENPPESKFVRDRLETARAVVAKVGGAQ